MEDRFKESALGEPLTRTDLLPLTGRRRLLAALQVAAASTSFSLVALLALLPLAAAGLSVSGLVAAYVPRVQGKAELVLLVNIFAAVYVCVAAALVAFSRRRLARHFFFAWLMTLVAGQLLAGDASANARVATASATTN